MVKGLAVALAALFVGLTMLWLVQVARSSSSDRPAASTGVPVATESPATTPMPEAGATQSPMTTTTATPVPPPVEQPITVSGTGTTQTAPFVLNGGTYTFAFRYGGRCTYFTILQATAGPYRADFGETIYGPFDGVRVLSVPSGMFVLEFQTHPVSACPWTVTVQSR